MSTWTVAFEQVRQLSPAGADLLCLIAFLAPDTIPRTLLVDATSDALASDQAIEALRRYSFLTSTTEGDYHIHRLVQATMRDSLSAETRAKWVGAASDHIQQAFAQGREGPPDWSAIARLLPHAMAVATHFSELPTTPQHQQQELGLRLTLGSVLTMARGYGTPEVHQNFERAYQLCRHGETTPERFAALCGLWVFAHIRNQFTPEDEISRELLTMANETGDSGWQVEAHVRRASSLMHRGKLRQAKAHFEQMKMLYNPQQHASHTQQYGQDPNVVGLCYLALTLWLLGHVDQADQTLQDSIELAHELNHPFNVVYAYDSSAILSSVRREYDAMAAYGETAFSVATTHGFAQLVANSLVLRGYHEAQQETDAARLAGIDLMRTGVKQMERMGSLMPLSLMQGFLAERLTAIGQFDEGLDQIRMAFDIMEDASQHFLGAELYRFRGDMQLRQPEPDVEQAEADFHGAIAIAQCQDAKSWELRAALSLSRLWQAQGQTERAHTLLADIYGSFTEGFETPDLQAAQALLSELAR